jgi:hypothetical protein
VPSIQRRVSIIAVPAIQPRYPSAGARAGEGPARAPLGRQPHPACTGAPKAADLASFPAISGVRNMVARIGIIFLLKRT